MANRFTLNNWRLGPPSSKSASLAMVALGLIAGLGAGAILFWERPLLTPPLTVTTSPPATVVNRPPPAPVEGAAAPDFTLEDLEGQAITLSTLQGHPIIINFWATWCGHCAEEMPLFQQSHERYHDDGLVILGVNSGDRDEEVSAFASYFNLTFKLLLDRNAAVSNLYRVRGLPTTFFVDRNGIIVWRHVGTLNSADLNYHLSSLDLGE